MKPSFDICLIMKNEAQTLPRLLSSLEEFKVRGGQVYILDTGSSDDSVEIACAWGCVVREVGETFVAIVTKEQADEINARFVVEGDQPVLQEGDKLFKFDEARNYAASLSPKNWVWMPDCDEVFTKLDLDAVEETLKDEAVSRLSYQFIFAHDDKGEPTIKFQHSKMYRKDRMSWRGICHEVLMGPGEERILGPGVILLEHFQNSSTNRSGYLKGLAYACLPGQSSAESPDRASHYFAREMFFTGRFKSAIRELERHIAMNAWSPERSQSAVYIGQCYEALGDEQKAIESYHRALQIDATRREPLMRLAWFYFYRKDYQRVALYVEAALTILLNLNYLNNAADYRQIPHELAYWAYWYLGEREKSKEHWQKCSAFDPENEKYLADGQFYR